MYVACSTSASSVSLSDVACFSIFPNVFAEALKNLSSSQDYWCFRDLRGWYTEPTVDKTPVGSRVCLAGQSEIERCQTLCTTERTVHSSIGRDL